ncbi:MAG TPA: acetyl-CoA C-acyltransferase, partial [Novosphingobium sp.]|nr:acetyl-CoA C-acyltransferase [Novosphingobium sp.]
MSEAQDIFIVSGVRTAIGDFGGALKGFAASDLGARVVAEAVNRAGLQPADIGHVVLGQVFITGAKDAYIARVAALNAGVPVETPALTVNRLCGSGVQAIISAAQMMKLGEASITVAGGAESMSNVPYHDHGVRWGKKMGNNVLVDALTLGLSDPIGEYHMGVTAENVAEKCGVSREAQDQLAVEGHVRAARAIAEGRFKEQILPI